MSGRGNQGPWSYQDLADWANAHLGITISKGTIRRYFTVNSVGHLNDSGDGRHKHFTTEATSKHQLLKNIAALHEQKAANQRAGRAITVQSSDSVRDLIRWERMV